MFIRKFLLSPKDMDWESKKLPLLFSLVYYTYTPTKKNTLEEKQTHTF